MKRKFYAIYDKLASRYTYLFESENNMTASRLFQGEASRKDGVINQNPEDFKLYTVAEFDDINGEFTNHFEKVCDAIKQEK
jgi:hypothetical protein